MLLQYNPLNDWTPQLIKKNKISRCFLIVNYESREQETEKLLN